MPLFVAGELDWTASMAPFQLKQFYESVECMSGSKVLLWSDTKLLVVHIPANSCRALCDEQHLQLKVREARCREHTACSGHSFSP